MGQNSSKGYSISIFFADKLEKSENGSTFSFQLLDKNDGHLGEKYYITIFEDDNFKRGVAHKQTIEITLKRREKVHGLQIKGAGSPCWKVDTIQVRSKTSNKAVVIPVFTTVMEQTTYTFRINDSSLPQYSQNPDIREKDLKNAQKDYKLTTNKLIDGAPPMLESVPKCEDFSFKYMFELGKVFALSAAADVEYLIKHKRQKEFQSIDEMKDVYDDDGFKKPTSLNRWRLDEHFGMQRLAGINCRTIQLCKKIPQKFPVTENMVAGSLGGQSLKAAIENNTIFIVDYEILNGLPAKEGYLVPAPIALFFQTTEGKLIPIAIQLFQEPSESNPIFLPTDDENVWTLAKMWFNLADATYHQSVAHLGFTHLKMEGVAACTHRQLHRTHPVFKLLMPHFIYLLPINQGALSQLISEGGIVDNIMSLGSKGMMELVVRKNKIWRLDEDGTLPEDLKKRGVDDKSRLPKYYYRDDALQLYNAIKQYVENYLGNYYLRDEDVVNDYEIQAWRSEMVAPTSEHGLAMLGVFGNNNKFETKGHLTATLVSLIFICSVEHAAVNFLQYDSYAFLPNFPGQLNGVPPRDKTPLKEDDLMKFFPEIGTVFFTMTITRQLSTQAMQTLGYFEVNFITDVDAVKVVNKFRQALKEIAKENKEKNTAREEPYTCLSPDNVPNAISI